MLVWGDNNTAPLLLIIPSLSFREKIGFIARATFQHARNLAFFTTLYKSICYLLWKVFGRRHPVHNFIAAFTCGYFVFGENNKVNMQVRWYY